MKLGLLFTAATLCFSSLALANVQTNALVPAHKSYTFPAKVSQDTTFEVWTDEGSRINCGFHHVGDPTAMEHNTQKCVFHVHTVLPVEGTVDMTNLSNHPVHVHFAEHK